MIFFQVAEINEHLRMFLRNISSLHISLDNYLIFNEPTQVRTQNSENWIQEFSDRSKTLDIFL